MNGSAIGISHQAERAMKINDIHYGEPLAVVASGWEIPKGSPLEVNFQRFQTRHPMVKPNRG